MLCEPLHFFCSKFGEQASTFVGISLHPVVFISSVFRNMLSGDVPFYFSSVECTAGPAAWQLLDCLGSMEVKILRWSGPCMWRRPWIQWPLGYISWHSWIKKGGHSGLAWANYESFTNECLLTGREQSGRFEGQEHWAYRHLPSSSPLSPPPPSVLGIEPKLGRDLAPTFFLLNFEN